MIKNELLSGVPLLILANKQDLPEVMGVREIKPVFQDSGILIGRRDCLTIPISALTGCVIALEQTNREPVQKVLRFAFIVGKVLRRELNGWSRLLSVMRPFDHHGRTIDHRIARRANDPTDSLLSMEVAEIQAIIFYNPLIDCVLRWFDAFQRLEFHQIYF